MPPLPRPFPRFIADYPQEESRTGAGRSGWRGELAKACEPLREEAGAPLDPETLRWFPERTWGGRVYVPATGSGVPGEEAETGGRRRRRRARTVEYFGWVSFERSDDGEPGELRAQADFTDVTAEDNPDWKIDLSDDVIGAWRADEERGGDVTLIWGLPMVRGAVAATAELDGEVLDQAAVQDGRFTLIAVDAVRGFGDELYVEIKLWDRTLRQIAAESLYD